MTAVQRPQSGAKSCAPREIRRETAQSRDQPSGTAPSGAPKWPSRRRARTVAREHRTPRQRQCATGVRTAGRRRRTVHGRRLERMGSGPTHAREFWVLDGGTSTDSGSLQVRSGAWRHVDGFTSGTVGAGRIWRAGRDPRHTMRCLGRAGQLRSRIHDCRFRTLPCAGSRRSRSWIQSDS